MKRWSPNQTPVIRRRRGSSIRLPPPTTLAAGFLLLILLGAVLLRLPVATREPITWLDALFTATSAVTVTGLVVVDTGSAFTHFGQVVIALLIQLGGLGLMTFTVMALSLLGHRLGLRQQVTLCDDLNQTSLGDLSRLVRIIMGLVIVFEGIGMLLLTLRFVPEFGWGEGLFQAFFLSISAFNNAGFALFPDSLSRWVDDPIVNLVVPSLFIIGGLGFAVLREIGQKRRFRHLSLHAKLMLIGTLALNLWAITVFLLLEWDNPATLGGLHDWTSRLWAGWFQAVTTRTAGFNTIDIGGLHEPTELMFISLMFIGGGSTSTAGGIKVTTFVVLLLATAAFLRKRAAPVAFDRSIAGGDILKVLALTFIGLMTVMIGIFLLTLTHHQHLGFLDIAFESASAFGTVGLSRGITGEFDSSGRIILMLLMFIGRIGPLSLGFMLATPATRLVNYPPRTVYLG